MKKIIKMKDVCGEIIHTRSVVERFRESLNFDDEYLLDMEGVVQISRSATDELYNIMHGSISVDVINLEPFVAKMLDVVTKGRFLPRIRQKNNVKLVVCNDMQTLSRELLAVSKSAQDNGHR